MPREFEDLKDGTVLEPFHINIIYHELIRLRKMTVAPPLVLDGMASSSSAPFLWGGSGREGSPGKASGNISAASGATPGTGTVELWEYDGSVMAATGETEDVLNLDTLISSGKFVWIQPGPDGQFYVSPMQCEG
jgi:hypothetical protein